MKTINFYRTFTLLGLMLILLSYVSNNPPGVTNAPGETSCATNGLCHIGPVNSSAGFGEITVMGGVPANGYVPDQSYTLMPFLTDSAFTVRGFQTVALFSNNTIAGNVLISNPTTTQMISFAGKEYVTQTLSGSQNPGMHDWMYEWTAPPAGSGAVTVYGAFVAADGQGDAAGDRVYTDSLVLQEDLSAGWALPQGGGSSAFAKVFPNPAQHVVHIPLKQSIKAFPQITLWPSDGRQPQNLTRTVSFHNREIMTIDATELKDGIYLITVEVDNQLLCFDRFLIAR